MRDENEGGTAAWLVEVSSGIRCAGTRAASAAGGMVLSVFF